MGRPGEGWLTARGLNKGARAEPGRAGCGSAPGARQGQGGGVSLPRAHEEEEHRRA